MLARAHRMTEPLMRATGLVKSFAVRTAAFARPRVPSGPWTGWTSRSVALRRWPWSANPAAARARSGASCCGCRSRIRAVCALTGRICCASTGTGLRRFRRRVQVVFQDPFASLDPRERIRDVLTRPMRLHGLAEPERRAAALMERVGLPASQLDRLPHQFSGGQRQRIAIARALSVEPELVVCDEPVSALDVSVQAQIVNLLADLQRDTGVALLFISHDLAVVRHLAHRVAVMYAGRVMEQAPAADLFARPAHPYTRALLAAAPRISAERHEAPLLGEPPDLTNPQAGCRFAGRCPHVQPECRLGDSPPLQTVAPGHESACLFASVLPPWPQTPEKSGRPMDARIAAYRQARDMAGMS